MRRAIYASLFVAWGCGSDPAPQVEILEVTPTDIVTSIDARNDVKLRLHYFDDNGDLGEGLAEIHDCRVDGLVTTLLLPPIANEDAVVADVAIEGELSLLVNDVTDVSGTPGCSAFGQPAPAPGQLSLCVVLVDLAWNRSEADCSQPIAFTTE
jgi:hypothetical protein